MIKQFIASLILLLLAIVCVVATNNRTDWLKTYFQALLFINLIFSTFLATYSGNSSQSHDPSET